MEGEPENFPFARRLEHMKNNDFDGNTSQGPDGENPQYANPQQSQNPPYSQSSQYQGAYQQNAGYQAPYPYNGSNGGESYQGQNGQIPNYGTYNPIPPTGPQGYYPPEPYQKWNTLCIIGFVLSFLVPIIGLVLSIVALVQINHSGEKSKGMAIAGIVISAISSILSVILVIALITSLSYGLHHFNGSYCDGSDCSSDPFDDDDDPDDDADDTGYTYYLYDSPQTVTAASFDAARSW